MPENPVHPVATIDTQQVSRNVASAIGEIRHLATLPEGTARIIQLVEDPNSTSRDLNRVINNDPALAARILKVVNSSFYGVPRQIDSIERAIMMLGLKSVRNIAIATGLSKLMSGGTIGHGFDIRDLWTHSIATAIGTQLLAERTDRGLLEEAFLAGLIHNIGIMVEIQARQPQFLEALETALQDSTRGFRDIEMEKIGATHEHFGAGLCKLWKFPPSLAHVAAFHHHPWDLHSKHRALTALVHVADIMASRLNSAIPALTEHTEVRPRILRELKLTTEQLDELAGRLPMMIVEVKAILPSPGW